MGENLAHLRNSKKASVAGAGEPCNRASGVGGDEVRKAARDRRRAGQIMWHFPVVAGSLLYSE